jgi:hypothetical protein
MSSSKKITRTTGDWQVQSSKDIHLETKYNGGNSGTVYIWGNLNVQGSTTTFETENVVIGDKVLILNKNEPGIVGGSIPGVSGDGISGLSISRGGPNSPNENANILYNQNKFWTYAGDTTNGMWEFVIGPPGPGFGEHSGLIINAIRTSTADRDLSILGAENPNATVTLSGVLNYTSRIVSRNNPDDVPNKGYVDFAIEQQPDRRRLQLNFRNNVGNFQSDTTTFFELVNQDVPGYFGQITEPQIRTSIGGNQWITIYNNRLIVGDFKITDGNRISIEANNTKMIFSTKAGGGSTQNPSVELETSLSLVIDRIYQDPISEVDRLKIYSKDKGVGGTGLYFVNNNTRDELPSKRKSFFASLML